MGIKNGNNKTVSKKQKKKVPWYLKLFLLIAIVLISLISFKVVNKQYNYWLFNQAEVKLQKLALPESDKTEYAKSCSYISTKNLWAGFPNCRVQRVETYTNIEPSAAARLIEQYVSELKFTTKVQTNFYNTDELITQLSSIESVRPAIELSGFSHSLTCYINIGYPRTLQKQDGEEVSLGVRDLTMATNCYKKSLFQLYPKS